MTKFIPCLLLLLASCATPRYSYYFDHYKSKPLPGTPALTNSSPVDSPLVIDHDLATAGTTALPLTLPTASMPLARTPNSPGVDNPRAIAPTSDANKKIVTKPGSTLPIDRRQLKQVVKQIRREMRSNAGTQSLHHPPTDQATQKLDDEVIVAIAFGAVGITLSLLGGISAGFWIAGVVLLGIGVYFFFDWLSKR